MSRRVLRVLVLLVVVAVGVGGAIWAFSPQLPIAQESDIPTVVVGRGTLPVNVYLNGELQASRTVQLTPPQAGMALRLVGIPAGEDYAPLWDVAAHGTLGAIILPAGPYGAALEATEAIWTRLRARSPRAVHLLLPDAPGLSLSDSARGSLPHLEGGSFFVLPPPSSLERLDVLRSVFARLVP